MREIKRGGYSGSKDGRTMRPPIKAPSQIAGGKLCFLITGCARSGTKYVANLLTEAGARCGHERSFTLHGNKPPGSAALVGESSCLAVPHIEDTDLLVVHLIRPPLDVIASPRLAVLLRDGGHFSQYFAHHAPSIVQWPEGPKRAADYWLSWNDLTSRRADITWGLHELTPAHVLELSHFCGLELDPKRIGQAFRTVPQTVNRAKRNHPSDPDHTLDLSELGELADEVVAAAHSYRVPLSARQQEEG